MVCNIYNIIYRYKQWCSGKLRFGERCHSVLLSGERSGIIVPLKPVILGERRSPWITFGGTAVPRNYI